MPFEIKMTHPATALTDYDEIPSLPCMETVVPIALSPWRATGI